jgi:hypothetical protein
VLSSLAAVIVPLTMADVQTRRRPERWKPRALTKITWAIVAFGVVNSVAMLASITAEQFGRGQVEQDSAAQIRLRATVERVVPLQQFQGTLVPVHFDPRFALTLRIGRVAPPVADWTPGSRVTFAIHSPAQLFAGDTPQGQTLEFVVSRQVQADRTSFSRLMLAAPAQFAAQTP